MLNFNSILLGSAKPKALIDFYQKVFDRPPDWSDGGWSGWQIGNTHLTIGEHSEVKGQAKEPQRIIMNFETKQVKQEFSRIKKFGAKVIKEPYEMSDPSKSISRGMDMWIATFADPDGNYFQLMSPWEGA